MSADVRLVEVVRSGFVEGGHSGSLVILDPEGSVQVALGDVDAAIFPRSANKLMQAAGLVEAGLPLQGSELALAAASHSGEPVHLAGVRAILAGAGLDESALQTPTDWPLDPAVRDDLLRTGGSPSPIAMNCSGKHAAMLALCVRNGWPTDTYLDPEHPVQQAVRATVEKSAGQRAAAVGVDGCGAPLLALSLRGLASAYSGAVLAPTGTPARQVADAMRAWPFHVGGTGRFVTRLMTGVPGLLVKDGAEGVCAGALPDGTAFALKVVDGAERAGRVLTAAVLRRLGADQPVLDELATLPLLGGGRPVGEVRVLTGLLG